MCATLLGWRNLVNANGVKAWCGWLGLRWPSWLTCSGRFTHISGHPSAAGRARRIGKVRRSKTNVLPLCNATNQLIKWSITDQLLSTYCSGCEFLFVIRFRWIRLFTFDVTERIYTSAHRGQKERARNRSIAAGPEDRCQRPVKGSLRVSFELLYCMILIWRGIAVFIRAAIPSRYVTSHPGQLSLLPSVERETSAGQNAVICCGWGVNGVQTTLPHRYGKLTCHMGSHSVTFHPAEVRIPPLPLAKAGTRFSDFGEMQGWVQRTGCDLKRRPVSRKSNALPQRLHANTWINVWVAGKTVIHR